MLLISWDGRKYEGEYRLPVLAYLLCSSCLCEQSEGGSSSSDLVSSPQTADALSLIQNDTIAKIYWKQPISAREGEGAEISRESGW